MTPAGETFDQVLSPLTATGVEAQLEAMLDEVVAAVVVQRGGRPVRSDRKLLLGRGNFLVQG